MAHVIDLKSFTTTGSCDVMRRKRAERERLRESAHREREREHTTCRSCGGLGALLLVASANWKPSVSTAQTSERRERALKARAKLLTLPLRFVCSHTNTRTHTYSQYINEFLTRRDFTFEFWLTTITTTRSTTIIEQQQQQRVKSLQQNNWNFGKVHSEC